LIGAIAGLRDRGNTVVVVEHEEAMIRGADMVVEIGPSAGERGGRVVFQGTPKEMEASPDSLTGDYLSGRRVCHTPERRRQPDHGWLRLAGARGNNLQNLTVEFPLGVLCVVTGVSGAGKSTLVEDTLYPALCRRMKKEAPAPCPFDDVYGDGQINDVLLVDQSPIGRSPRSNPVTYIKAFDAIRELFASLPESKKHGYAAGHFSFNIPGGRCETCSGDGTVTVEMQFLADVELLCEDCKGTRYKPEILAVRYHGKNIHNVLDMTVKEALGFFAGVPKLVDKLRVLEEVGLGYLRLGQSATTLSGGEAQRMKLAAHLQPHGRDSLRKNPDGTTVKRKSHMLYIFDEPTTGLHVDDVSKLLAAFKKLIDAGGSIVVIEHNLDVIKVADWVIDLGPEGGERGGEVVAVGTPEEIAANQRSYTGQWLRKVLPLEVVVS
jgi:excinuclease ABC subunit A